MADSSAASPQKSPHLSPKNAMGQDSPTSFVVLNDADLANHSTSGIVQEEGPSAADYDPTMDMQEDQLRSNQRHHDDESSSFSYKETAVTRQDVLIPEKMVDLPVENKTKDGFDMFAEGDEIDMFAEAIIAPEPDRPRGDVAKAFPIPQAKALDMSMLDDWDDHEGYYKVILGELLDGRYHVQSNLGKGMFSGVVRATDQKTGSLVAIKLIRNNETM